MPFHAIFVRQSPPTWRRQWTQWRHCRLSLRRLLLHGVYSVFSCFVLIHYIDMILIGLPAGLPRSGKLPELTGADPELVSRGGERSPCRAPLPSPPLPSSPHHPFLPSLAPSLPCPLPSLPSLHYPSPPSVPLFSPKSKCRQHQINSFTIQIGLDGKTIERVEHARFLGVCVDEKLRWNEHIN